MVEVDKSQKLVNQAAQRGISFLKSLVEFWRMFKKNRAAVFGLSIFVFFALIAIFANFLMPFDPWEQYILPTEETDPFGIYKPPSTLHWLGTDDLGRDVLSRVIWGSRISMMVGFISAGVSAVVGISLGSIAGYFGGKIDNFIMRITDVFFVLPTFFLVLIIVSVWGRDPRFVMIVIGITIWPSTARLVRAEFLSFKEQDFTMAAQALGAGPWHIIFREILPNAAFAAIVNASMQVAGAIMTEASLSFLGLGDPSAASWGWQLQLAMKSIRRAWWVSSFPGLCITLVVISFNLVGDGLNDALNPHLKER